jgi:NADH dehydrogenase [ubiquinone] 1 alpha subcomplex assembly factor 7
MICLWLISSWKALGSPDCFSITELGPGKGTLMQAVVQAAALDPVFLKSAKFHFIETSSHLKSIQKEKLASVISDVDQKCVWHDSLHTLPDNIPTLFIAHEFFDALPIYQFCYKDDIGWSEIVVDWSSKDDKFFLGLKKTTATALFAPSSHNTRQYERVHDEEGNIENVVNLIHFPTDPKDGEIFEVCPEGLSVAQELGERISRSRGALLMIDYGSESFSGSSLRGIRDHKFVDFFETPGLIDITADVDFSAYGRAFKSLTKTNDQGGVTVHPLIAQSQFLLGMGMHLRFDKLIRSASTKEQKFALFDTLERLVGTKPESMGQVYKVLMVSDRSLQCLNDSPILISKQSQ